MNDLLGVIMSAILTTSQIEVTPEGYNVTGDGCDLHINRNISHRQPLVLKRIRGEEEHYEFDEPDVGDEMLFTPGENVLLACPGSGFLETDSAVLNVNCVGEREFHVEQSNEDRSFEDFQCSRLPESTLKRQGQCAGDNSAFAIGFEVGNAFVKIIDICFDENTNSAVYAKHKITPNITGAQRDGYRITFKEGGLFSSVSANDAYHRPHQKRMFAKIVSNSVANKYINDRAFMARGHLAPKADFIFDAQQAATFYYANAGPQWQTFNGGNWEKLERAIRKLVIDTHRELTVYTGTYGTYEIDGTKMFLASDSSGQYTMPIPMIYWKVLYDENNQKSVAFIGLNDPYADPNDNPAKHICSTDICHLINWVSFKTSPVKGLMYCCEVDDFTKTVKTLPPIGNITDVLYD